MKHNLIKLISVVFIFLLVLMTNQTVSASKIKVGSIWSYKDKNDKLFDENALSLHQIISGNTAIGSILVNTTRGYDFPYNYTKSISIGSTTANVTFDLVPNFNGLFVTEEGGITLFPNGNITGTVTAFINETKQIFEVNETTFIMRKGDPSNSLFTTVSEIYLIEIQLLLIKEFSETMFVNYATEFVISSSDDFKATKKNFTVSQSYIIVNTFYQTNNSLFDFQHNEHQDSIMVNIRLNNTSSDYNGLKSSLGLSGSNFGETSMKYTFEEDIIFPTYIAQSQGPSIINNIKSGSLSLSQTDDLIEYFLVHDDEKNTEDDSPLIFISIPIIILIVFYRSYKKKHY